MNNDETKTNGKITVVIKAPNGVFIDGKRVLTNRVDLTKCRKILESYKTALRGIQSIIDQMEYIWRTLGGRGNPPDPNMPPRQPYERSLEMRDYHEKLEKLQFELDAQKVWARNEVLLDLQLMIFKVEDVSPEDAFILEARYTTDKTIAQICEEYSYSKRQIQNKLEQAIIIFGEVNEIYVD
jgi:hypothetical protein